jgi:polar amino acid transport system permease protein
MQSIEPFGWIHLIPLLRGALYTIYICFFSIICGGILGIAAGLAVTSKNKVFSLIFNIYINLLRGIPVLILVFVIYFAIPIIYPNANLSKGVTAVAALSIYAGAYIGEIVRGSIQAIPKGQFEAARSLGLNYFQEYFYVIIPQALRIMIPPVMGFIIALVKDSSLISVIGYVELTKAGKIVSNLTMEPLPTYVSAAAIYFVICFGLSKLSVRYENRINNPVALCRKENRLVGEGGNLK